MKNSILKDSLIFSAFAAIILILSVAARDGGWLHGESAIFLLNYCDSRTILQKVFDPLHNDWNFYQARELSYLFDMFDAYVVDFLLRHKIVWFHSLCSAILLLLTVFLQQYYGRKLFHKLPGIILTLLSLCFLLSPNVMGINYFRTAKYLSVLGVTAAMGAGYELLFRRTNMKSKVVFVAALTLMVLSDRQGFFFAAAFTGTLALLLLYSSFRKIPHLSSRFLFPIYTGMLIVLFGILNNLYLTPAIVRTINGYSPDFNYQMVPENFELLQTGLPFICCNISYWFCSVQNFNTAPVIVAVIALFFLILCRKLNCFYLIGWGALIIAMILCSGLMLTRHPVIQKMPIGFYFIVILSILFMLLVFTFGYLSKQAKKIIVVLLFFALIQRVIPPFYCTLSNQIDKYDGKFCVRNYNLKHALITPDYDVRKHPIPYRRRLVIEHYQKKNIDRQ